jgi:hypothetical protein
MLVEFSTENWPRLIVALQYLGVPLKPFGHLAQGPMPFKSRKEDLDPVLDDSCEFLNRYKNIVYPAPRS